MVLGSGAEDEGTGEEKPPGVLPCVAVGVGGAVAADLAGPADEEGVDEAPSSPRVEMVVGDDVNAAPVGSETAEGAGEESPTSPFPPVELVVGDAVKPTVVPE